MAEFGPVILVEMAEGVPLSAEQGEDRTFFSPGGGGVVTQHIESRVYRDSRGRIRLDWQMERENEEPTKVIYLLDPRSDSFVIAAKDNVAARVGGSRSNLTFAPIGRFVPGRKVRADVEIGTRVVQDLVLVGSRTTWSLEDDPMLGGTEERWLIEPLRLCYSVSSTGPTWKHEVRLSITDQNEPDPSLWLLPLDCKVQELDHRLGDPSQHC